MKQSIILVIILLFSQGVPSEVTLEWQQYVWPRGIVGTFEISRKRGNQWKIIAQGLSGELTTFIDDKAKEDDCYRMRARQPNAPQSPFTTPVCFTSQQ